MRKSHLLRGCVALAAVPLSLTALVVAASPAAACGGANAGVDGRPVEASVGATAGTFVCVQPAGEPSTYLRVSAGALVRVAPTFDCVNATAGAIGDPSDPTTYVPYRVGYDAGANPLVCAEAAGVAVTVQVVPNGSQPRVWIEQFSGDEWNGSCDGSSTTPHETVFVSGPGVWQEMWVGVGSPFGAGSTSDCAGSDGEFDCRSGIPPMSFPGEDDCPDGFAATQTVYGLPAYALAFADETGDTVVAIAGDAVTTVLTELEPVLIEVGRILAPLFDEAWRVAGTVVGVVDDYVALGTTQGDCTVNVASAGDVAIMRSPTGQVPTSICLVVGSAVTRVTIG